MLALTFIGLTLIIIYLIVDIVVNPDDLDDEDDYYGN